jgi:hypothetical protein
MIHLSPRAIIFIGFILVLLGFLLPLLMVVDVLESTYFLNFFSFTASLIGLFLGMIGTALMAAEARRSRDK